MKERLRKLKENESLEEEKIKNGRQRIMINREKIKAEKVDNNTETENK